MSFFRDSFAEETKPLILHPALEQVVSAEGLNRNSLGVSFKTATDRRQPDASAREQVLLTDGTKETVWRVPSVRTLFRGDIVPPSLSGEPPPPYYSLFKYIETHVLTLSGALGDKTDGEFEEAFSNLRRRPDGKSLSPLHFYLWQVGAAVVGQWEISAAEFDALFGRLAISAATFRIGLVSRNYLSVLRRVL